MRSSCLSSFRMTLYIMLLFATLRLRCQAFAPVSHGNGVKSYAVPVTRSSSKLQAGLFDNIGSSLFGNKERADPNAPKRLFEIPVESIKIGGLRFTLGLHLLGQRNKPEKGSWLANQADDGVIDMFFKDETGMFSISFSEKAIMVDRYGPKPSLQYLLQESVVLHGVLDELHTLAFEGDDIEEENRLIKLKEPGDAIEKARETLPARQE